MTDKLNSLYKDVYNWLTFAEAKNAALLTLNMSLFAFMLNYIEEQGIYNLSILIYFFITLILSSSLITLYTFLSKIYTFKVKRIGNPSPKDNLLYYKDIVKYSVSEYYDKFSSKYFNSKIHDNDVKYNKDIINQIITISSITYKKYYLFNIALFITMIPFIIMIIMIILA